MTSMTNPPAARNGASPTSTSTSASASGSAEAPTFAVFPPSSSSFTRQNSTILVHQKSPLLIATPPQVTRALAYSHPFLLPLNKVAGLVTWTTGDPWESFLVLSAFWAATLYGDVLIRWLAPMLLVTILVLAMYARRYSPLSSTGWSQGWSMTNQSKEADSKEVRHHKSLDEIVETINLFTSRCNILLEPLIRLTDFLSTQRTATSATTRPALITLFIRLMLLTPFWFLLTLPPLYIITTRRIILVLGSIGLTWHSRPARISRTILWRSRTIRRSLSLITGLELTPATSRAIGSISSTTRAMRDANAMAAKLSARRKNKAVANGVLRSDNNNIAEGIRFSFALFENQRRWLGAGWTTSMVAYERAAWTDEDLQVSPSKDQFTLPVIDGGIGTWRWCEGSSWTVEGPGPVEDSAGNSMADPADSGGWIFYDTQWRYPKRLDGWGRYTRRRKWVRDAELVEVDASNDRIVPDLPPRPRGATIPSPDRTSTNTPSKLARQQSYDAASQLTSSAARRRTWFGRPRQDTADVTPVSVSGSPGKPSFHQSRSSLDISSKPSSDPPLSTGAVRHSTASTAPSTTVSAFTARRRNRASTSATTASWGSGSGSLGGSSKGGHKEEERDDDGYVPLQYRGRLHGVVAAGWGVGEDVGMELG